MAREVKKRTVGMSPNSRRARLQEQITAINEQLILSSMHEHDLREQAEDLAAQLRAEISEREQAEEALRGTVEELASALKAKDEFLAMLSHELRTPLTPVLMTAASLEIETALPSEVRDQLGMMRRNIELEARLIDDLLDLTRISNGKLQIKSVRADIHELLEQTAEIVRDDDRNKQVRIVLGFEAEQHYVMGDPARLQQLFWNIIKNAHKFSPASGIVTVGTRNASAGKIIISVADTGIGIRAEELPHIFNAFEQGEIASQKHFGGLGLGLAISRAIAKIHGGEISAESDGVGRGATFSITFAVVGTPEAVDYTHSTSSTPGRAFRLLVVEDHEATLGVLRRLLTRCGHHLTAVSSVREGLAAAAVGTFDAVISDLGLPDGTGFDLIREIHREHAWPGIALSGYGMDEDVRRSHEAGFRVHLVKPIDFKQLQRALEDLVTNVG